MSHGPKNSWTKFLLGTAMGGFLFAASGAWADVPRPTAPLQGNGAEVRKLLADAQTAVKSGNLRLAAITLKKAIQIAPSNNDAHMQLGLVLFEGGDLAGGERELRQARKGGVPEPTVLPYLFKVMLARQEYQELVNEFADPGAVNSPLAPNLLKARAFALQRLGRPQEATDAADRALKLERDGDGLMARAGLAMQQGDFKLAGKFADEAVKSAPADVKVALFKLSILIAAKNGAGALAFSDQLLAKFPGNLQVQYVHIEQLLDQKQYAKAKSEIDSIIAKRPGLQMPVYYQALLASQTGDAKRALDLALTLPQEFLEVSPDVAQRVAQMALAAGRQNTAVDILGRVLKKDPDNLTARRRLASLYLDQRDTKSALNLLAPLKDSSDPQTVRLLSRLYTGLKRKDDAQAVLLRLGPSTDHAFVELRAGHTEQAITEFKEVAAREPGNISAVQPLVTALLGSSRFAEALEIADRFGRDANRRGAGLVFRGNILMAQRKLAEAQGAFDKAVALDAQNQAVRLARANFFIATRKYEPAAKDLQAVLASDPRNAAARVKLADIATQQGKDQEARRLLSEAIAVSPGDALPRLALIRRLVAARDFKAARKASDELARLQPTNADGVALQGQILSLLDRKDEAVESFRYLASLTPNIAQSQLMLAEAQFAAGDRAGAMAALDAAAEISPQSPTVAKAQTDLQFAFGNADTAVSKAQDFQAAYPGTEADLLLADTLAKAKRFDQAADVLGKSLAAKPDGSVLSRLVQLKLSTKDKPAARTLLSQWLARNPNDVAVRHRYAQFLMSENDTAGARAQYEAILKQDANDTLAMNNLGSLLQSSDPGRASLLLTKAVQLAPNSPDVNDSLGWLKVQQKDAAGGLPYLRRAHNLGPQNAGITYHLIVALDANARRDDARALLKALLASEAKFQERADAARLASAWR